MEKDAFNSNYSEKAAGDATQESRSDSTPFESTPMKPASELRLSKEYLAALERLGEEPRDFPELRYLDTTKGKVERLLWRFHRK